MKPNPFVFSQQLQAAAQKHFGHYGKLTEVEFCRAFLIWLNSRTDEQNQCKAVAQLLIEFTSFLDTPGKRQS